VTGIDEPDFNYFFGSDDTPVAGELDERVDLPRPTVGRVIAAVGVMVSPSAVKSEVRPV
jgi:hypothetical protein